MTFYWKSRQESAFAQGQVDAIKGRPSYASRFQFEEDYLRGYREEADREEARVERVMRDWYAKENR